MTKTKALKLMLEYERALIDPALAHKIAKAFGYTLADLKIKPKKCKDFYRARYMEENLTAVATYNLAEAIAQKFNTNWKVQMPFQGWGRNCEWATKKSVEEIKVRLMQRIKKDGKINEEIKQI